MSSIQAFRIALARSKPGDIVPFVIYRDGKRESLRIEMGNLRVVGSYSPALVQQLTCFLELLVGSTRLSKEDINNLKRMC